MVGGVLRALWRMVRNLWASNRFLPAGCRGAQHPANPNDRLFPFRVFKDVAFKVSVVRAINPELS